MIARLARPQLAHRSYQPAEVTVWPDEVDSCKIEYEIDLILDLGSERWAIEIKLTSSPSPAEVARLEQIAKLVDATRAALICRTHIGSEAKRSLVTDVEHLLAEILAGT